MAANINADTSGGLKLTSDTSGVLELKSAGTTIATVNSTGLAMASGKTITGNGNLPAFSAYIVNNQSIANVTLTKANFDSEEFDTNSAFDPAAGRFTVPSGQGGKYVINQCLMFDSGQNSNRYLGVLYLYKNNAMYRQSFQWDIANGYGRNTAFSMTNIVELNAADYLETFVYYQGAISGSGLFVPGGQTYASFSGHKLIT